MEETQKMKSINFKEVKESMFNDYTKEEIEAFSFIDKVIHRLGALFSITGIRHIHRFPPKGKDIFNELRKCSIEESEEIVMWWCDWVLEEIELRELNTEESAQKFIKDILRKAVEFEIMIVDAEEDWRKYIWMKL